MKGVQDASVGGLPSGGLPGTPPNSRPLPGPITSVCFSKDGQCALAASLDSTLRLLDKETGELLGEYEPPSLWPRAPLGGLWGEPRLILLPPGTPRRYTGHRSTAYRLDCVLSEQDTHVGSASEDGNVYFWDLVEVSGWGGKPKLWGSQGSPPTSSHPLTGLAGAQPGSGPQRGAVPLLPPHPALLARCHRAPRPALARGDLPARGGCCHMMRVLGDTPGACLRPPVTRNKPAVWRTHGALLGVRGVARTPTQLK